MIKSQGLVGFSTAIKHWLMKVSGKMTFLMVKDVLTI